MTTILEIGGVFYAYVPPQVLREPFEDGRFYRIFNTEQEAIDFLYGVWPEED